MKKLRWLLISAAALGAPAMADSQLKYSPAPTWATLQPLVVKPVSPGAAAVELLMLDTQYRLDPVGIETVVRYAARLNTAQALAGGNLAVVWDPEFDSATVNSVRIIRGSTTIDPLASGQKFTILRREQGLEQQTLDGRLTATLQVEGLQVGDVVELTQTLLHRDPTLKGHVEAATAFTYPSQIAQARMRVVVPASLEMRQRTTGGLGAAAESKSGREKVYQWDLSPLQPDKPAEFAPLRYRSGLGFEMSDFRSWNDLAEVFLPLFEKAATIGPSSPLQGEIARIKAATPDPKVRAAEALALVQGKVRYVNIALGIGGLVPVDADTTWQRRFGDCKAKSALLTGILRALGIDATPVLVSTVAGDGLDQRLPMISEFNHVIVRATIDGREYWVDGTRIGDASLDVLEVPPFRWALPIVANAKLLPIVQSPLILPRREKIIVTDASEGIAKPAPTTLDLVLRGDSAILENTLLTAVDAAHRDELIKQQMQSQLDRFVVSRFSSTYDPVTQTSRLHAEGTQTLNVSNGTYWSETPSAGYKADFRRTSQRDQDAPVALDFPTFERAAQTLILPKTVAASYSLRPADIATMVAGVEYKRTVTRKGAAVTIDTSTRSLVPEISIAQARAAEPELRRLDNDNYSFTFQVAVEPTTEELTQLVGTVPKTSSEYAKAAMKFANGKKTGQAIAMLDKAIALDPAAFDARSMRASLHAALGEDQLALADVDAALKVQPVNPQARALHASLMFRQGNRDAALADAQALAPLDNAVSQLTRARILAQVDRIQDALAALDLAIKYDPDPLTYVYRASLLPVSDRDGRRRAFDTALKLNPHDAAALSALATLARELGDNVQQLALLDQAFLLQPDNLAIRGQRAVALVQAGRTGDAAREFDALATKDLSANDWNNQCMYKAVANVELDRALEDCGKAIASQDRLQFRDSRGFVLLRLRKFDEAIKEYDLALGNGDFPEALYGRAIAYAKLGKKAESDADAAKAMKLNPRIARQFAGYGVTMQSQ